MKWLLTIGLLTGYCWLLHSQELPPQHLKTIAGNYTSLAVDHLDQLYLVGAGNQLHKLSGAGDSLAVFNETRHYGELSLLDVSNPVSILLYFRDFATILILDGMLQVRQTIDLRRQQLFNVSAAGLSYDGKIWLYDNVSNTLKKIDERGKTLLETADFRQLFDQALHPVAIFDRNQYVYLYDSTQGIYVFDYYGTYKARIPVKGWQQLTIRDKIISGSCPGGYCRYHLDSRRLERQALSLPFSSWRQLEFTRDRIYGLSERGLEIYRRTAP